MGLRPGIVDDVLRELQFAVRVALPALFVPEDAVLMGGAHEHVVETVLVDVEDDEVGGVAKSAAAVREADVVRMLLPGPVRAVLVPEGRREDVVASVAVQIAAAAAHVAAVVGDGVA